MSDIQLNFLELEQQEISIPLFRKKGNEKLDEAKYFGGLPNNIENQHSDDWSGYSISIIKIDEWEEFNFPIQLNHALANRIIFDSLCDALNEDSVDYKFKIEENKGLYIDFVINEFNEGNQVVYIQPYFLKSQGKFGFLIDFKFKQNEQIDFNREAQKLSLSLDRNYRSNRDFYKEKYYMISKLFGKIPSFKLGNSDVSLSSSLYSLPSNFLDKKNYIFRNNNISNSQFNGVKKFGAFKEIENPNVHFYFIFSEKNKGLANDIFLSLIGKKSPGTFPGMKSMFNIDIDKYNVSSILFENQSIDGANQVLAELENQISKNASKTPFVLYIEENNHEEIYQELYGFFKLNLLKRGIAFQVVTNEKLGNQDTLKWSISSVGLQIFSKLGGIPWLVKPSKENCLILGIGQAYGKEDENGVITKQFAYSVCIDSTGLFKKVEILSKDVTDRESFNASISENLEALLKSEDFKGYKKCAIHIPFKVSRGVVEAIRKTAQKISSDIDLKIIKVNTKNKFFGYSTHLTKVPYESSYIKLSEKEFLVWFEGLNYGKEIVYKKPESPVHIEFLHFEGGDNQYEMDYLQDILNLSGGNWRGFNAKSKPISIYYSQIIAKYTQDFECVEGFNKEIFINNKPWFL
jgi:hypothetical protein